MALIDIAVFAAGFAGAWLGKDTLTKWVVGAEAFVKSLEAKLTAAKAAIAPPAAPPAAK